MKTSSGFERIAGFCAIVTGLVGFLYAISFIVLRDALLSSIFLMLGGLFGVVALVRFFYRLGEVDSALALLGLTLASFGALGAAIHGSYDLANVLHPPAATLAALDELPNQIDPRGFLTFGVAGLALLLAGYLAGRGGRFPKRFDVLTHVLGALLIVVYLGRLIVLIPSSPFVLYPAAVTGFIVNPIWYVWLGALLTKSWAEQPALVSAQS